MLDTNYNFNKISNNLGIEISSVNQSLKYNDVDISLMINEEEGNHVTIPMENYDVLKCMFFYLLM